MGRTARDSGKTPNTYRIRLTESLLHDVDEAWRAGPDQDADRQTFLLKLLRLGIEEYERVERLRSTQKSDHTAHPDGGPSQKANIG